MPPQYRQQSRPEKCYFCERTCDNWFFFDSCIEHIQAVFTPKRISKAEPASRHPASTSHNWTYTRYSTGSTSRRGKMRKFLLSAGRWKKRRKNQQPAPPFSTQPIISKRVASNYASVKDTAYLCCPCLRENENHNWYVCRDCYNICLCSRGIMHSFQRGQSSIPIMRSEYIVLTCYIIVD